MDILEDLNQKLGPYALREPKARENEKKKRESQAIIMEAFAATISAIGAFACANLFLNFGVTAALVPAVGFAFAAVYIAFDTFQKTSLYVSISNLFSGAHSFPKN